MQLHPDHKPFSDQLDASWINSTNIGSNDEDCFPGLIRPTFSDQRPPLSPRLPIVAKASLDHILSESIESNGTTPLPKFSDSPTTSARYQNSPAPSPKQESKKTWDLLRTLVPFFLFAWMIVCGALQVSPIPQDFLASLCDVEAVSRTPLCTGLMKFTKEPSEAQWADFSTLVLVQNTIADTFVGEHPGGSELALKIAKAELATSDLVAAVRYSSLRSAERLAEALADFVTDAAETGDSLQELDAKALGAIDSIININDWALQAIDKVSSERPKYLASLAVWRTHQPTAEVVAKKFSEVMGVESAILSNLIYQAKHCQGQLKRMKEGLQAIRDFATRENILITAEQGELLASIWTILGANRAELKLYETNLQLLGNLERYTDEAKVHISQALFNLKTMQAQMKDLREKVSQPDITGVKVPVDVHIRTIAEGIQRMKEGRIRAREKEHDLRTLGARVEM